MKVVRIFFEDHKSLTISILERLGVLYWELPSLISTEVMADAKAESVAGELGRAGLIARLEEVPAAKGGRDL